jgi:transcriptional regulator with XRE-family HTH domain
MNIGEKIYHYRIENKMSQGDLANALDVSRQSVSKWETNTSVPELSKLIRMSELFGISIDELVRGDNAKEITIENQTSEQYNYKSALPARKIVGLIILCTGIILFFILLLLSDLIVATILSSPLFICAVICLLVRRHPALFCCWTLYILVSTYIRYATGIRFWWIFSPWLYQHNLNTHAVIAWIMSLLLAILIIITSRLFYKFYKTR